MELLTAMTVLTIMLVMVNQMVNSTAAVMAMSGRHLDADIQARMVFNRMAVDFAGMLKRTDVDYSSFKQPSNLQTSNDEMAFYCETHGYFSGATQPASSGKGDVSLVAYMVANDATSGKPVLQRLGKGLGWQPDTSGSAAWTSVAYLPVTLANGTNARWPNLFSTTSIDADYRTVGDLVFRLEYTYLLKVTSTQPATLSITPYATGHTSVNGFEDVAAVVVTMAMLDNSGRGMVSDYTKLSGNSIFTDAVNGATPSSAWNAAINSPTFASTAGIPPAAASNVRAYERYFYLDSP